MAQPRHPVVEWYPVGRMLLWTAGFAAFTTMGALLTLGTDGDTIVSALRRALTRILGSRGGAGDSEQVINAAGDDRAGCRRHRRDHDADAQSLARRPHHRDIGPTESAVA